MGTYYKTVEKFIDNIDRGVWIEIGVDRGEGSTQWFADLAKTRATEFYGVDADPDQIMRSYQTLCQTKNLQIDPVTGSMIPEHGPLPDHVKLIHARGEDFLASLHQQKPDTRVSLVYLDNFDWDYWVGGEEESFVPAQKEHYLKTMGVEMNNINSQTTHLAQAMRLMSMMSDNSIIICDDTWYHPREGIFIGKCSGVIPFLLLQGYQFLHNDGYRQNSGVILGRFKNLDTDSQI
jgi:hypothetical protein